MRVGVDATSWTNRRGYGRFARNVVTRLIELDPETEFMLCVDGETAEDGSLPPGASVLRVHQSRRPADAASNGSSRKAGDLLRLTRAVRRDSPDVFVFPSVYTYFPVLGIPTVVGIHDAITEQLPHLTVPGLRARTLWRAKQRLALRGATRIFTVSEASRSALAFHLGLDSQRVTIVPEAPDPIFYPRPIREIEPELRRIGVDPGEPFVLYAGGISPHKSVETLVAAIAELGDEGPRLVLVGDLETETYVSAAGAVRAAIAEHGIGDRVVLPGYVSDETLACLYGAATVVVNSSLAEGFGLPAVEAAACGAPLVLSDIPAHRETLDGAASYFPTGDAAALASQLERLLGDEELRVRLAERAQQAVERFSWDAAADRLRALIAEAAGAGISWSTHA